MGFSGPFVCETNVGKVLYGLTSWSFTRTGCGAPGVPDGFADVRTALSWIQKVRKFIKLLKRIINMVYSCNFFIL